ncbi:hypothetical protein GKIL_1372 [Gloeobacter kilaueensis JS1]|uniref:Uncharacterized protein n=2 Tax=Gloeobacter TaxID=33071 RepID=U5QFF7_GLOK1|nr:hypothetical protein GKIL_1372 [Gloeobacter kilaueensis JS1]
MPTLDLESAAICVQVLVLVGMASAWKPDRENRPSGGAQQPQPTCHYYCGSPYLRCAVHPERKSCRDCPSYRASAPEPAADKI